jgi:hypothetical protein
VEGGVGRARVWGVGVSGSWGGGGRGVQILGVGGSSTTTTSAHIEGHSKFWRVACGGCGSFDGGGGLRGGSGWCGCCG